MHSSKMQSVTEYVVVRCAVRVLRNKCRNVVEMLRCCGNNEENGRWRYNKCEICNTCHLQSMPKMRNLQNVPFASCFVPSLANRTPAPAKGVADQEFTFILLSREVIRATLSICLVISIYLSIFILSKRVCLCPPRWVPVRRGCRICAWILPTPMGGPGRRA